MCMKQKSKGFLVNASSSIEISVVLVACGYFKFSDLAPSEKGLGTPG